VLLDTSVRGRDGVSLDSYELVISSLAAGPAVLTNSMVFAIGGALVAVTLGTLLAWLAERTDAPFTSLAYLAAFISFAVPGIIQIISWIFLFGPRAGFVNVWLMNLFGLDSAPLNIFSMGGMIVLEGLSWAPVVFLLMASPFRAMDPALEESAATSGANGWWVFSRITLRLALPSVAAVLLLTLVRSLQSFDIAALVGIPAGIELFTTRIYLEVSQGFLPRYGDAAAYSVVLIALVALVLLPYFRLSQRGQRFATITGRGFRPRRIELGRWRILGGALMLTLPALLVLPISVMLWASLLPFIQPPSMDALRSMSLDNYASVLRSSSIGQSVTNTLIVSAVSATVVTILTLLCVWVLVRTRMRGRWTLDLLGTIPLVLPGIVLGLAVMRTYIEIPLPIYGTIWIIAIAFTTKFLPYGMRYNQSGLLSIHGELEESAQMSGAPLPMVVRRIVAPLMMPALVATWIYVFLVTSHELSEALLLTTSRNQVLAVTIFDLWQDGQFGDLTAFSVMTTFGLVVIAFGLLRISRNTRQTI
jgi:iron(III) transport system permease protein